MDVDTFMSMARSAWVVWLMGVFLGIVLWAFWPANKKRFDQDAMVVFDENDTVENGDQPHG